MLAMDLSPPSSEARPVRPSPKRGLTLRFAFLMFGLFFFLLLLLLILSGISSRHFEWLSVNQSERMMKPGPLARLKSKLQDTLDPVFRRFQTNRTNISIELHGTTFSPSAAWQGRLGPPAYTNSDGVRCWILSSEQRIAFIQRLDAHDLSPTRAVMPITVTEEGRPVSTWTVSGSCVSSLLANGAGTVTNTGATINMLAKLSSNSVKLLLSAASTEVVWYSNKYPVIIKSNFVTACRVLVPDSGAVLIDCGRVLNPDQTNQWLMVSPILVDEAGIPIKR
jgi:hypothetical protein